MMGNGRNVSENPMPVMDDSWWESVLAEESRHSPRPAPRSQTRPEVRHGAKTEAPGKSATNWEYAKDLFSRDEIVGLHVIGSNRGGLLVEGDGLYGFVPFSHLVDAPAPAESDDRENQMKSYAGRLLRLKVIECVPEDGRVVFSERAAQAGPGRRSELFHSLRAGECVNGTVTNITDFGVFVDLGGVEGLVHISELSWGRVAHPGQLVKIADKIDVQVLEISPERSRVALSVKRLLPNPWTKLGTELSVGQIVSATVTSVLSYGAFARLDMGLEGLIHASEIPIAEGRTVRDVLHDGEQVQVRILHVDAAHQRMGLSMKL
jgi:small subunit ribosomal protein S1